MIMKLIGAGLIIAFVSAIAFFSQLPILLSMPSPYAIFSSINYVIAFLSTITTCLGIGLAMIGLNN